MEPLQPFLAAGILSFLGVLAAWNVLERRRYAPKALLKSFEELSAGCEGTLKSFSSTLKAVVDGEENRRLEAVKLRREFLDLIDQEEEVLGRIDTKNRRIQSAEARAQKREHGNGPQVVMTDDDLLASIRSTIRAGGVR